LNSLLPPFSHIYHRLSQFDEKLEKGVKHKNSTSELFTISSA
jgi:hypothetical protein